MVAEPGGIESADMSEERYRQFFEAAPDGVFLLAADGDSPGQILDANTLAARLHGYERDELLGMNIADLDAPEGARLVDERIATLKRVGHISFEVMHRRKDGSLFPVEVSARTATIDGRECIVSFNRDITYRHEYEAKLREQKLRLDLAARSSQVGFWDWDIVADTVYYSPEWKAQIGYEPHEIEGSFHEWESRVHPEDLPGAMAAVQDHFDGKTPSYVAEFRLRHKDGSYRWVYVRGEVQRDPSGAPIRFVGCHVDITARKDAERERSALARRVGHLQRLEAIGTLAGGIAHDFNNILAIITGNIELAAMGTEDPSIIESLDEMRRASDRARSLVRQVLAFSRGESPQRSRQDLGPVVKEAVLLLRSTMPRSVKITTDMDPTTPQVAIDAEQIHQVLVNLGTNAWHALGEDGGSIVFRVRAGELPADMGSGQTTTGAVIEVEDDGPGMSEEVRQRLFEPFFTTKGPGEGSGLGLSMAHGILRQHGGSIEVAASSPKGTTFRIGLPEGPAHAEEHVATTGVPKGSGIRVLLLDDEPALLRSLRRGLESFEFAVTAFDQPAEALAALRADPASVDVVVTDYDMPGCHGVDVARVVRGIRSDLPVVLCSGYLRPEAFEQVDLDTIDRVVYKPVVARELGLTIEAVV